MPRILVVDDDRAVLATIEIMLLRNDFEVVAVRSGSDAVPALQQDKFEAVIVDLFMPGMNGLQTIEAIRSAAPDVPIIAMSGVLFRESASGRQPDFLDMAAKGVTRILHKPFKSAQLVATLRICADARDQAARERAMPELDAAEVA